MSNKLETTPKKDCTRKTLSIGAYILIGLAILLIVFGLWFLFLKEKKEEKKQETKPEEQEQQKENINYDEYEYTYGMLIPMTDDDWKPLQTDFVIDGMILIGNKHSYFDKEAGSKEIIQKFVEDGYKTEGINSFFYTDEEIRFYMDSKEENLNDISIFILPLKTKKELISLTYNGLLKEAKEKGTQINYQIPDQNNYKYVGSATIEKEENAGQYTVVITYKEEVVYYMHIIVAIEPKGE